MKTTLLSKKGAQGDDLLKANFLPHSTWTFT